MSTKTLTQAATVLTEPFVRTGLYDSSEKALKHIILAYLDQQITWAESHLRRYERKHQQTFEAWTEALAGRATVAEEDEWMEWEATRDMLEGWRQIKAQVEESRV